MINIGRIPNWLARPLLLVAGSALVGVSAWHAPLVTASLWRVLHPRGRVVYRGLYVQVPWPWIADTEGNEDDTSTVAQGLVLRKMPHSLIRRPAPQSIFVTVISDDPGTTPAEQTDQWVTMFRESHRGYEFSVAPAGTVPAGTTCTRAVYPAKPNTVVWTCISMHEGWVANLEGRRSEEPDFFQVVDGLRR